MIKQFPFYIKYPILIVGIIMAYFLLSHGAPLLIPVAFAVVLALALFPVFNFFHTRLHLPEIISIMITIVLSFAVLGGIFTLIYLQLLELISDAPGYIPQLQRHFANIQDFIERNFGIASADQIVYLEQQTINFIRILPDIVIRFINQVVTFIFFFSITAIYTALFLYYRRAFKIFLNRITPIEKRVKLKQFFSETNFMIQNYIGGVFLIMLILAIMNTSVLMLIGIEHALFFGLVAALLNIVPYIGVFIGSSLPFLFALITRDNLIDPILVVISFNVIQTFESNFLTPNIIGNKVQLSPLLIILIIFMGGMIWGPAGMILFIPYLAIVKALMNTSDKLQPHIRLLTGYAIVERESFWKRMYGRRK